MSPFFAGMAATDSNVTVTTESAARAGIDSATRARRNSFTIREYVRTGPRPIGRGTGLADALRSGRTQREVSVPLHARESVRSSIDDSVYASQDLANIRLMVASNHTAPQLKAGCLELGADGYFDKVKELGQLAAALAALAEAKQAR